MKSPKQYHHSNLTWFVSTLALGGTLVLITSLFSQHVGEERMRIKKDREITEVKTDYEQQIAMLAGELAEAQRLACPHNEQTGDTASPSEEDLAMPITEDPFSGYPIP